MHRADVPFRIGHHFASKLTDYGRGSKLKLNEIPYAEAARIYHEQTHQALPLTEAAFHEVISAEYMVFGRKGAGGPQLAEMQRMLAEARTNVAADLAWLNTSKDHLATADTVLEQAFISLSGQVHTTPTS